MRFTLLLFFLASVYSLNAQSLRGNLRSEMSESSLGYGNVDIYMEDKLVASVLTDREGNFNVPLDTGVYRCVINYAGHLPVEKQVHVVEDEKADFSLKGDPSKPKLAEIRSPKRDSKVMAESMSMSSYKEVEAEEIAVVRGGSGVTKNKWRGTHVKTDKDISSGIIDSRVDAVSDPSGYDMGDGLGWSGAEGIMGRKARSGTLTAGEVNDFSKWKMWQDLNESELKAYRNTWKIAPQGRYTLMLQNQIGLPLADAKVQLVANSNEVIFTARTDNTGKAELWLATTGEVIERANLSMTINYRGMQSRVKNVKPFSEEINFHTIEVDCNEMNDVDIAFVVDATGSMSDELSYLQAEMNDVIYKSKQISKKLNFHFANVFYRDQGSGEEYLTRTMDFSRVLSESVQFITKQFAGGGGDYEEAVEVALDTAINHLKWSEEARARIIFLILDAPPHNVGVNRVKMNELMRKAAENGIKIVPVGASGINKSTEYLMRTLAVGTNGTYTFLTNDSGIGNGHIAPSTDSYKVETFNDLMTRIIKSYTYMPDCEQIIPDLDLDYPDSTVSFVEHIDSSMIHVVDSTELADSVNVRDTLNNQQYNNPPQIQWSYYPNPTTGIINIRADVDIDELFLSDLSGKLLQSLTHIEKEKVYQMDLSKYTSGIYLIRYLHEDHWISGKVMLRH